MILVTWWQHELVLPDVLEKPRVLLLLQDSQQFKMYLGRPKQTETEVICHCLRVWLREEQCTYRNHDMAACACSAFWYGTVQKYLIYLDVFFSTLIQCYLLPLCIGCYWVATGFRECTAIQQFSHEKEIAANFQHLWRRMGEMLKRMVTPGDGKEDWLGNMFKYAK